VKVLDVDIPRKRISLTLRLDDEAAPQGRPGQSSGGRPQRSVRSPRQQPQGARGSGGRQASAPANSAMADALRRAGLVNRKGR
jgi:uncharacterized protein